MNTIKEEVDVKANVMTISSVEIADGINSPLTQQSLRDHIRAIHSDQRFECTECENKFKYPRYLKRHMERQHESNQQQCLFCDFYSHPANLKRHINKSHSNGAVKPNHERRLELLQCDTCR